MRPEYDFSKGKRGAVIPQKGKSRISIFIDNAVLEEFRARAEKAGTGYQTMMNEALRQYLAETDQPITETVLRNVLREELPDYLAGTTASSRTKSKIATNVFIVGAGFTKAIFPKAPLNYDLFDALSSTSFNSASLSLRDRYKTQDIEIALTRLDADIASSRSQSLEQTKELQSLRRGVERELASYFGSFLASEDLLSQSPWLRKLVDYGFTDGDVAISLNYDCILEGILDCGGKWSANGGYGSLDNPLASNENQRKSPVTVLKIHGSANFVIAPYLDKPDAHAVNFVFDERYFPRSAKNTHFGYGGGTGSTYLIAPSYVKIPTVDITYLMLDALVATTRANNLVVIGSALRPEDGFLTFLVTNFLHQESWRDRKIIIVDPAAEAIGNRLKNYWGVNVAKQILPIDGRVEASVDRLLEAMRGSGSDPNRTNV